MVSFVPLMCYLCVQGVPGPNVYFRLVLLGHADCNYFRTTKQLLLFFFCFCFIWFVCLKYLYVCEGLCEHWCDPECVKMTASLSIPGLFWHILQPVSYRLKFYSGNN